MHVYARFHCICPCPVPCKGCLGWQFFTFLCGSRLPDKQWLWAHMTSSAMHLTCSTCSTCSPPCKTGHVCFLAGAVVWNTQPSAESSVQRQAHILSYLIQVFIQVFDNVWYLHGSDSFNSRDILGWKSLLSSADRKDYLTCGICGEHLAGSSAMMQWLPPASTCSVVSNRQIRQYNLCCHDLSMLIMIWFRKICQCCQRARFDEIWLLELILAESKDQ